MSINDSSALILIVGALAVLAFVIHGLWFSGRSVNRKLSKDSKQDQEIIKSQGVGKVRIVTNLTDNPDSKKPVVENYDSQMRGFSGSEPALGDGEDGHGDEGKDSEDRESVFQLLVTAGRGQPFRGEDIEDLCRENGFIRNGGLFYVYEDPEKRDKEVFKICSLEKPYRFPDDLKDYETTCLCLFMKVPERGKAASYFRAQRFAAELVVEKMGGEIQDSNYIPLSAARLDKIEADFTRFDQQM